MASLVKTFGSFCILAVVAFAPAFGINQAGYEATRTIAGTLASIAATMVGFVVAAAAILLSVGKSTLLSNMRKTGHYAILVKEFLWTVLFYLAAMLTLIAVLFVPDSVTKQLTFIGTMLFVLGSGLFVSSGWKFWRVVEFLD